MGVGLDHLPDIEDRRQAERRRVGLDVRTLGVVLASPPLVALVHHRPRVHGRVGSEQGRRLGGRHELKSTEKNMAIRLEAAHPLSRRVAPLILVNLVEAEGFIAADPVALGHKLLHERGEALATPPTGVVGDGHVGPLGLALGRLAPDAQVAGVHIGLGLVVVERHRRRRIARRAADKHAVAALERSPLEPIAAPGHLHAALGALDAHRSQSELGEARLSSPRRPRLAATARQDHRQPGASLLATHRLSHHLPVLLQALQVAVQEGVLSSQPLRRQLGRRARRAKVHRPQPPRRARLQHRLRVAASVRVVQLAPIGLWQAPARVTPHSASARPPRLSSWLGGWAPAGVDLPRRGIAGRLRRHPSRLGGRSADDLQPSVARVVARTAHPAVHRPSRPGRIRLEVVEGDPRRSVLQGRHAHRQLPGHQLGHVGRDALGQPRPRHVALVHAHSPRVLLHRAPSRRTALHGVEVTATARLPDRAAERIEPHPSPTRAEAASMPQLASALS